MFCFIYCRRDVASILILHFDIVDDGGVGQELTTAVAYVPDEYRILTRLGLKPWLAILPLSISNRSARNGNTACF